MQSTRRIYVLAALGAIVAAFGVAVHTWMEREDATPNGKPSGIENFIPAREFKQVPLVQFIDENGTGVTLEQFRGRVVVLNLWATWCTPCIAEMPMLDRLQQQLGDVDATVLALSIDREGPPVVREFYDRLGVQHLKIYVDPTMRAQAQLGAFGLPTTIIIDRQGRERGRLVGPAEWDDAAAVDLVLSALAEPQ